jgi:ABC-type transport system involved in Fe-S cluster assembly fused permease/ATPase subunit
VTEESQSAAARRWTIVLVAALFGWGVYHAVGAYLFNHDARRAAVVLVCMALFVSFWLLLLRMRAKRLRRDASQN